MTASTGGPARAADAVTCAGLEGDLGWALGVVFRCYAKAAAALLDDVPGGPRAYQVLTAAGTGTARTQLALAARMGVDRTVMTYLLDDLEQAGLIQRHPDPADRRARRITVTAQGRALLADLTGRLRRAEDDVLGALGTDDRVTFRNLLRQLADQASAPDATSLCQIAHETVITPATRRPPSGR